jgi:hypothetical protein
MKIKIVSDGTSRNTRVIDAETGEVIQGARKLDYRIAVGGIAICNIEYICTECEMNGVDACFKHAKLFGKRETNLGRGKLMWCGDKFLNRSTE